MKFKKAMNKPDSNKWREETKNEHTRMMINGVWEPLDKKVAKVKTSTWVCKKKSNST